MKAHTLLFAFLAFSIAFSSCKKEEDTIALIHVVDVDGEPIELALVKLFPEPSGEPQANELIDEVEQLSDAAGEAIFDFSEYYEPGQAGFAVLSILVTKDTAEVEGIIKIEPEMINEETLILQ